MSEKAPQKAPAMATFGSSPPQEPKFLYIALSDWGKALIGAIFATAVGIFVGWVNSATPHLTYSVSPPVLFHGEKTKFGIISFSVVNEGTKEAENVVCTFNVSGAKSPEIKVSPDNLNATTTIKNETVAVTIPSLNPAERASVITYIADTLPAKPEVSVRSKGFNGVEVPDSAATAHPKQSWAAITSQLINVLMLLLVAFLVAYFVRESRSGRKLV